MTRDMNTIYGQDLWNSGADKLRSYGAAFFHFLRCAAILILMIVGVSGVKGQDDYSGFYYIANYTRDNSKAKGYNENDPAGNYYLCPAALYYNDNPEMPYLTTKRTNRGANSIWELRKVPDTNYYYIIHYEEGGNGRYLVHNAGPISGKENRFRVHLEANPTLANNDNVLFTITNSNGTFKIRPNADNSDRSLNPASGNKDSYTPFGNENIGGTTYATGGIIGLWAYSTKADDAASRWYLEKAAPIIRYNSENTIKITYPDPDASIYYSFGDDSTPVAGTNSYSEPFNLPSGTTTIKAIAIKDGEQSGIATYKLPFLLGSTHKYIIQSENCQFYRLIPNVSVDDNTKYLSTLNVPSSTMSWHFEYAEDFYYYIVDENGWYMYYTTTDNTNKYIYLKNSKDNDDDGFKFNIEFHANGGYNIMPKGQALSIYKNNYGSNDAGLIPVMYDGTITEDVARWDLIPYSTTNLPMWEDAPFTVSTDAVTNYYNIVSVSTSKPIILNNSGDVKSEEVPTSDYDERKAMWVIKKVGSDTDGLLDYYTLQNAYTGDYLYYNGKGRNIVESVLQLGLPTTEGADATWSHFVIVQTANNGYNIIPRPIVDNTKAINRTTTNEGFNCINRRGGNDILGTFYDDGNGSRWTFSQVDFCMPPVFEETEGNIKITCATNGAEIHFTNDGTEPTDESTLYENGWSSTIQNRIKAIAIVKSGESVKASSAVVTLLNKPDIELKEGTSVVDEGTYTYDGIPKTPTPTKVYIGTTETETGFALASTDPYLNNTNAGTATVNVIDNDATDTWYILHASETFNIKKKEVTITADDATKAYDGTALTKDSYTSTALGTGDKIKSITITGSQTVVGSSDNVPSEALIENTAENDVTTCYNITYVNGTLTISKKDVKVSGITAKNKVYDGNTTATLEYTNVTLTGKVEGETLTVTATGTFDNKNVGTGKTVTISGLTLDGTDKNNYQLATTGQQESTTADITAKEVTASGNITTSNKVYDGNTTAALDYTNVTLKDQIEGDDIAITATGTFADKNVGTGKTITISLALSGSDAGNYNLKSPSIPASITADITAKEVTASGTITAKNKEYDGKTTAELDYTNVTLTGKVDGDDLKVTATGTYADKDIGTGKTVNISGWVLDGTDKENYQLASSGQPTTTTADITVANITVSGITAKNKVYDGNTTATLEYTSVTLTGKVEGETLTVTATGTFDNKNVGTGKTVTISGLTLDGTDKNNYQLAASGQQTTATADITAKAITVSGITAENKVYDGTTTATLVYSNVTLEGKVGSEVISVTATGTFEDEDVGTDKTVNISGLALDGTDKENYQLATSGQQETTKANITTAPATVTAENKTKGYGDADPAFTWTVDGLLGSDTKDVLTVTISRETGEDVRATPYKITPAGEETQGNYKVTYVEGTLTITSKAIGDGDNPAEGIDIDITYDGTNYTVTVKQGENTLLEGEDKAYTWTGAEEGTDTYVVTITGHGNYNNSAKATYIKLDFYDTTPDQAFDLETTAAVYYAAQNLKVNESFEAYYVTNLADNTLTITKVEAGEGENKKNYIPEGQPVLLISETNPAPKGFTFKPYTGTGTDLVTIPATGEGANLLKVVAEGGKAVNLAEVYMFSMGEFVLTKEGTMSKGKFYLENPNYNTPAPSRGILSITSKEVTGVSTSQLSDTDSQIPDIWYTIGGQKLHKEPTRKGLYLQNGKKVVIK